MTASTCFHVTEALWAAAARHEPKSGRRHPGARASTARQRPSGAVYVRRSIQLLRAVGEHEGLRQETGWPRRKRGRWKAQDRHPGLHRVM